MRKQFIEISLKLLKKPAARMHQSKTSTPFNNKKTKRQLQIFFADWASKSPGQNGR